MADDTLVIVVDETEVTVVESDVTVEVTEGSVTVLTAAAQGPAGAPPVPPRVFTAGASAIGAQLLVALIDGALEIADPTNTAHAGHIVGMTRTSVGVGGGVTVDLHGTIAWDGADLTAGPYFVGLAGTLSSTVPVGAAFVQIAGYALTIDVFVLDLDPLIITV